jgi:RHS repeat-associated protein
VVSPNATFEYDALYRLVRATGREHGSGVQVGVADPLYGAIPNPNDATAIVAYSEEYEYDGVGNVLSVAHAARSGRWTRRYAYATDSNRLLATSEPGDPAGGPYTAPYVHDDRGNMTAMPHLVSIGRDFRDQIVSADLGGGGTAHCGYDGSNQRVRKRVERLGAVTEERLYLGVYEIYRRRLGSVVEEERETIHVMDDRRRIALVETATVTGRTIVPSPTPRSRYQLDNHLGSALLELDETAGIISYEEYRPYGSTAYHAEAGGQVSRKRYRYTGKEKDEETGLCYHGARYYAPWLARWASADPLGPVDGPNLFAYAAGRPLVAIDPTGTSSLLLSLVSAWAGGEEEAPPPEAPPAPARRICTPEDPLGEEVASPSLPWHDPAPWYMSEEEEGPSARAQTPAGARAWEEQKAIERYIGANPPPLPDIIPGDPVSAQANMRWEADIYAHFGYENPNQFSVAGITLDDVTSTIGGAVTSSLNVAHAATLKLTSALVNHNEYARRFLGYEASELATRTPFSYGTRGAGNRILDHYDPVGIGYEFSLQPWATMGEKKLELKQNQIQADVLSLRRGYVVDARTGEQLPLREMYWVGADPLSSYGFGGRIKQQLEGTGIPYLRFVPTGLRAPTRPRIIIP